MVPTTPEGLPPGFREYVVGFCFNKDAEVLLIEKLKPAWQKGKLNGVGGKIEPGEKPIDAMIREFREETGLEPLETWFQLYTLEGPDYRVYFYGMQASFEGFKDMTDEKLCPCYAFCLPPNVIYNLRWMIPLSLDQSIQFPITFRDGIPDADSTGTNK